MPASAPLRMGCDSDLISQTIVLSWLGSCSISTKKLLWYFHGIIEGDPSLRDLNQRWLPSWKEKLSNKTLESRNERWKETLTCAPRLSYLWSQIFPETFQLGESINFPLCLSSLPKFLVTWNRKKPINTLK